MPKIIRIQEVYSIKAGDPPDVAPNGTILNPLPYYAANITFDDGILVQVERPLDMDKIWTAYQAALAAISPPIDGIYEGQEIHP